MGELLRELREEHSRVLLVLLLRQINLGLCSHRHAHLDSFGTFHVPVLVLRQLQPHLSLEETLVGYHSSNRRRDRPQASRDHLDVFIAIAAVEPRACPPHEPLVRVVAGPELLLSLAGPMSRELLSDLLFRSLLVPQLLLVDLALLLSRLYHSAVWFLRLTLDLLLRVIGQVPHWRRACFSTLRLPARSRLRVQVGRVAPPLLPRALPRGGSVPTPPLGVAPPLAVLAETSVRDSRPTVRVRLPLLGHVRSSALELLVVAVRTLQTSASSICLDTTLLLPLTSHLRGEIRP